ncbi:MAG: hypothetical protein JWM39_71 [Parcubacteria group bacterium]|nr:hypothetical protein [Parcubacteria group bacterium]
MRQKWNAEIVISAVKELHLKGERINAYYIQENHCDLYSAGVKYHGTWRKVLIAAELTYAVRRRNVWSKEIILEKIAEMVDSGEPLNNASVKETHGSLYTSSITYFGGWAQALEAAGIPYDSVRLVAPKRSWSKELIVQEILKRKEEGFSLSGTVVQAEDVGLYEAAMSHFGKLGWAQARVAAGLPPIDPRPGIIYDKDVVIVNLRKLHADGVELHFAALRGKPYQNIVTSAIRLFGSYAQALEAAGLDYEDIRKVRRYWWTKEKVIEEIQALEKAGVRLSYMAIQVGYPGLTAGATRMFGTWGQAVEAAGISYRKHLRIWSTRAWLLTVSPEEYQSVLATSHQHANTRRRVKR